MSDKQKIVNWAISECHAAAEMIRNENYEQAAMHLANAVESLNMIGKEDVE